MIRRLLRRPALILAVLLVGIMFDVFALGATVLPHTITGIIPSGAAGYQGFRPERPQALSVDPAGAYGAEWPWAALLTRSIRSGVLPFWNPYQGLGQPQLANYVPAVLFPVNWMTFVLPPAWWDLVYFVDWLLAAYFVFLIGRMFGVGRWGALIGGAAMFAGGFFPAYLEVRSIVGTVASFPALIYGIERALRQPGWKWQWAWIAAATYGLATGGHPSPAVFGLAIAIIFFAIRIALQRARRIDAACRVLSAMLCGGLLAAPLLLPFAEHLLQGSLPVHTPDRGLEHFPWQGLALTVFPFLYGPMNHSVWGIDHAGLTWMPASVTCLACFGLFELARRKLALMALLAPISFVAAKNFGVPFVNDIGRLPLLNELTMGYSIGFVWMTFAILAGAGFARVAARPLRQWRLPLLVWIAYGGVMLAIGVSTVREAWPLFEREPWRIPHYDAALASGLFWAIGLPLTLVFTKWRFPERTAPLVLIGLGAVGLQAAACYPTGSVDTFATLQIAAAAAFAVMVLVIAFWAITGARLNMTTAVFVPAVFVAGAVAAVVWPSPRLPGRYNPLTSSAYVNYLRDRPNARRVHALDGVLSPDFASATGLTSVTNIDNLVTKQGGAFISRFLDRAAVGPARFVGVNAMRNPALPDPLGEFWINKRYWDLVGVRYVLTGRRDPNQSRFRPSDAPAQDLRDVFSDQPADVWVWENPAAAERAFLAPQAIPVGDPEDAMARLDATPDLQRTVFVEGAPCAGSPQFPPDQSPGGLVDLRLSANRVDIDYDAKTAGVLTLTDAHAAGWSVTVNGRAMPLLRVDGAFRGVCLQAAGRHRVAFVYRPPFWLASLGLCAAGGLGLVMLARLGRRPRGSSSPGAVSSARARA